MASASSSSSLSLFAPNKLLQPQTLTSRPNPSHPPSVSFRSHRRSISTVGSSLIEPALRAPDDLVASILSKVRGTDRGVSLTKDGHKEVADVALQLAKYCVDEPVKCPLIFGGKLNVLDSKWIQVVFEPPELKIGSLGFQYGGESEVKLEITYIDEKIRLGKGSRGSLFVFLRRG